MGYRYLSKSILVILFILNVTGYLNAATPVILLKNSGFEEGQTQPDAWVIDCDHAKEITFLRDSSNVLKGDYSACIKTDVSSVGMFSQKVPVRLHPCAGLRT